MKCEYTFYYAQNFADCYYFMTLRHKLRSRPTLSCSNDSALVEHVDNMSVDNFNRGRFIGGHCNGESNLPLLSHTFAPPIVITKQDHVKTDHVISATSLYASHLFEGHTMHFIEEKILWYFFPFIHFAQNHKTYLLISIIYEVIMNYSIWIMDISFISYVLPSQLEEIC